MFGKISFSSKRNGKFFAPKIRLKKTISNGLVHRCLQRGVGKNKTSPAEFVISACGDDDFRVRRF